MSSRSGEASCKRLYSVYLYLTCYLKAERPWNRTHDLRIACPASSDHALERLHSKFKNKLLSVDDRGQTDRIPNPANLIQCLTLTYDPDFQFLVIYFYGHAKNRGQRSDGSKVRAETNGWADTTECITRTTRLSRLIINAAHNDTMTGDEK